MTLTPESALMQRSTTRSACSSQTTARQAPSLALCCVFVCVCMVVMLWSVSLFNVECAQGCSAHTACCAASAVIAFPVCATYAALVLFMCWSQTGALWLLLPIHSLRTNAPPCCQVCQHRAKAWLHVGRLVHVDMLAMVHASCVARGRAWLRPPTLTRCRH